MIFKFFNPQLPRELALKILFHLTPQQLLKKQMAEKAVYVHADDNEIWNRFLIEKYKVKTNEAGLAKNIFLTQPEARAHKYVAIDKAGENYLACEIENALKQEDLTEIQKAHLKSVRVKNAIMMEEITIQEALRRVAPEKITGLNQIELEGIQLGLSVTEVKAKNFGVHIINAMMAHIRRYDNAGVLISEIQSAMPALSYEEAILLSPVQVNEYFRQPYKTTQTFYQYDAFDRLVKIKTIPEADNEHIVEIEYDALDRMISISKML